MGGDDSTAIQDDIVDHELLAAHDEIARLRQRLEIALAARDSIARDFLAASQAEQRAYRERDALRQEIDEAIDAAYEGGWRTEHFSRADAIRGVTRQRDDARSAGGAYKRDRDRWKAAAEAAS